MPNQFTSSASLAERFWSKVDTSAGPDACWPWTGATQLEGYGIIFSPPKKNAGTAPARTLGIWKP